MAYAFVQSVGLSNTTGGTLTTGSITVTAGNTLVVWCASLGTGTFIITANGNTFTAVGASTPASGGVTLSAYFCQNAASGATTFSSSDTGCLGIWGAEYSGIATSGGSLGNSFGITQSGLGANALGSGATGSITAPAAAFAFTVDTSKASGGSANTGTIKSGTTLAWQAVTTGRVTSWVDTGSHPSGLGEDIEVSVTATVTATFGTTGNVQFDNYLVGVFALSEAGSPPPPPVPSRGPMPKQIYIMP